MIARESLEGDNEILRLYRGAVERGMVSRSEYDRINYYAAAAHALRVARPSDTAGHLFVGMVLARNWGPITQDDEDVAVRRLRVRHDA